jgi:hypothetical protein
MGLNTMDFSLFWIPAKTKHEYMGNSGQGQKEKRFPNQMQAGLGFLEFLERGKGVVNAMNTGAS